GGHQGGGSAAHRGCGRRIDRRRTVVHPTAEQGEAASRRRTCASGVLRSRGARGVRGSWSDRRRSLPAGADASAVSAPRCGGAVPAARRVAAGAIARGARRDPVRRAAAVPALWTCRSRYGVLSGVRRRDARVVTLVAHVTT